VDRKVESIYTNACISLAGFEILDIEIGKQVILLLLLLLFWLVWI